jgi:hypothetical protein
VTIQSGLALNIISQKKCSATEHIWINSCFPGTTEEQSLNAELSANGFATIGINFADSHTRPDENTDEQLWVEVCQQVDMAKAQTRASFLQRSMLESDLMTRVTSQVMPRLIYQRQP